MLSDAPTVRIIPRTTARILIIEDDFPTRALLRISLERMQGWSVTQCESAEEALVILNDYAQHTEHMFNLIIVTLVLPKMNGFEFIRRVRNDKKTVNIPILLTSKWKTMTLDVIAYNFGASRVMQKPMMHHPFLEMVQEMLRNQGGETK